tara:strand:+ start:457 stop:744 length:288 start_codon:yes stop_codon:yes gene_type:complete
MHGEEECGCCCGHDEPSTEESKCAPEEVCTPEGECVPKEEAKSGPDMIRDILNFVAVKKEEEKEGTTTCIDPETAEKLGCMLENLAKKAAECECK